MNPETLDDKPEFTTELPPTQINYNIMKKLTKQFLFTKQFIFVVVAVVILVAGGILIFAINDKGAGPVAYWKLNEGSASSTYDSSGNANTGTLYGGVQWANGVYGSALQFDGVNDYVDAGSSMIIDNTFDGTGNMTFTAWYKLNSLGAYRTFFSKGGVGDGIDYTAAYAFTYDTYVDGSAGYVFTIFDQGAAFIRRWPDSNFPLNQWNHIVVIYTNSDIDAKVYINGALVGGSSLFGAKTYDGSSISNGAANFIIGGGFLNNNYFNGLIDDVRIYNYARTADQIKADYNAGKALYVGTRITDCDESPADCVNKGLVGHWNFDEMATTTAFDKSGNGNNGALGGGTASAVPTWTTGIQPFSGGKAGGGGLSFDGVDDLVLTNSDTLCTGDITVCAWMYPRVLNVINQRIVDNNSAKFYIDTAGTLSFISDGSGTVDAYSATGIITINNWYYICLTRNSAALTANFYSNGALSNGSDTSLSGVLAGSNNVVIGNNFSNSRQFNGLIDDVRVYNRVLSAAEIRYQYNQAKPIAYWKFDEGSASSTYDSSGNGNTGTLYGGVQWANGVYGTALSFDGSNDYVSVANESFFDYERTQPFAVSLWYKTTASGRIAFVNKGNLWLPGWDLQMYNGKPTFYLAGTFDPAGNIIAVQTVQTSNDGLWHHLTAVYAGNNIVAGITIYVDGVIQQCDILNSNTLHDSMLNDYPVYIGYSPWPVYFNGSLDDVRIYNYARTADQVRADYNAGKALYVGTRITDCDESPADCVNNGLVGYWDMDQMGGTTATDKSGNGNTGTLTNGPKWAKGVQPFSGGKAGGGALSFDGVNDYVALNSAVSFADGTPWTVSFWGYPTEGFWAETFAGGTNGIQFHWNFLAFVESGNFHYFNYGNGLKGRFAHYVITADSSKNLREYEDGVFKETVVATSSAFSFDRIGGPATDVRYEGLIDDVRVYNRVLSAEEVRYQYNQGKPIAWWKMDEGANTATTCNATISSVYDYSANGNTGALSLTPAGNTLPADAWSDGKYACALTFDGTDDYVDVSSVADPAGNFTISAWVKYSSSNDRVIIGHASYAGGGDLMWGWGISNWWTYPAFTTNMGTADTYQINAGAGYNDNEWHHIVGVYDQVAAKLYVDGVLKATGVAQAGSVHSAAGSATRIGMDRYAGADCCYFNGLIDDVRIYNYARTADQIRLDYNAGSSLHLGQ